MTRRFPDMDNPAPAPWTWIDTALVMIVSTIVMAAFLSLMGMLLLMGAKI